MSSQSIIQNIVAIQHAFQKGKAIVEEKPQADLSLHLAKEEGVFLSAIFEGAAYQIALSDIDKIRETWHAFLRQNPQHETQICVGLGWALAESNLFNIEEKCSFLTAFQQQKIADGIGFYEGTFRKRKVVLQQEKPLVDKNLLADYYAGLGRSLWYNAQGNLEVVKQQIDKFIPSAQAALWKGIGTAFTYVEGFSEQELASLFAIREVFLREIKRGIEACFVSRQKAGLLTDATQKAMSCFKV